MFNDRYSLTQAVIEGRKTMTRRTVCNEVYDVFNNSVERFNKGCIDHIKLLGYKRVYLYKPAFKLGEVVAVAQSYEQIKLHPCYVLVTKNGYKEAENSEGWRNKLYVQARLMPHQIRITSVRVERLQDISDEDCMKEEVQVLKANEVGKALGFNINYAIPGYFPVFDFPRDAFAWLIDEVSGRGTWERNPWVWVYGFTLIQ